MHLLIKVIADCNMRCVYCNEGEFIKKRQRMSLDQAKIIVRKFKDYFLKKRPSDPLFFIWTGGEPMMMGVEFYEEILKYQKRIIGDKLEWRNVIQTNLLRLNDDELEFLRENNEHFGIGVSFDFYGSDRRTKGNKNTNAILRKNIKRLQDKGVSFGIITMLTKSNVKNIETIYEFIHANDVNVSFYHVLNSPGNKGKTGLSDEDYAKAVSKLIELWWYDEDARGSVGNARQIIERILFREREPICVYAKDCQPLHMDIVPDGGVYPCIDFYHDEYGDEYRYGNIFTDSLEKIFASPKRKVWASRAGSIRRDACKDCDLIDLCEGGCPHRAFLAGRGLLGKDSLCIYNKTIFNQIMGYLMDEGLITKDGKVDRARLRKALKE